jgi:hypothetical protein
LLINVRGVVAMYGMSLLKGGVEDRAEALVSERTTGGGATT